MKDTVQGRIEREISGHDVVLFMKGTPVFMNSTTSCPLI